jgi:hypothetical protein|eukprot:4919348-Prymnesium_polylepis.1
MSDIPAMGQYGPLYLPIMAVLVRTPPFEAIKLPEDDSKQWEHLLSQENGPGQSDFATLSLHSILLRSRSVSITSFARKIAQKGNLALGPRKPTITKMNDLGL